MFVFTVQVTHASLSHVPITQTENINILVQGKPTEFRESCVLCFTVYTTRLFVP